MLWLEKTNWGEIHVIGPSCCLCDREFSDFTRNSLRTDYAWAEAGASCSLCDEISGQRTSQRGASPRFSSRGDAGIPRQCVCGELQGASLARSGAKRRYFCGGDGSEPDCGVAGSAEHGWSAAAGSVRNGNVTRVWHRVQGRLCLRGEHKPTRAIPV